MRFLGNRSGFALPMAILVIAVLTAILAAGFAATTAETDTNIAQRGQSKAYNIAESSLEQFLARHGDATFCPAPNCATDPSAAAVDSEYLRITTTDGYADVTSIKVRPLISASLPALFFVKARGVDTASKLPGAGYKSYAEQTVGVFASWNTTAVSVLSGWTSLSGLSKNGNSGTLSGVDNCPLASGGGAASVAAVAVPNSPGYSGPTGPLSGSPLIDSLGTQAQAIASVKIDWNGIVNNNVLAPDVTIPPGSWPTAAQWADTTWWPVILVKGSYSLPGAGRGTLIVTGDMTISGSNMWKGVLLVGGNLTSNGNNTVEGATVSALNVKLGMTVPTGSVGNGTKTYQYDSCNLRKAAAKFASYSIYANTWTSNVPSW